MAFVAGIYWPRLGRGGYQLVVLDGFLDSLCGGSADALVVDGCWRQLRGGLAGVAVVQVGLAESFQSACFLWGCANVAAMASAWAWLSRACAVFAVRVASSPRRLSAAAWPSRLPRSANRVRACWWLVAAAG